MLSAKETVARLLEELADREELRGTDYKPRAYRRAARNVRRLDADVAALREEGRLGEIEGVGDAIAGKIREALDTGTMDALEHLREEVPVDVDTLGRIKGLGTKKLATLWRELDVTTLDELEAAAEDGRVGELSGFGPKTVERILDQVDRVRRAASRWRLDDLDAAADVLRERLEAAPGVDGVAVAGAVRRRAPVAEGLTLVAAGDPDAALDAFTDLPEAREATARSDQRATVELATGAPAELVVAEAGALGATLLEHTGAGAHVDRLRELAREQGLELDARGLHDAEGARRAAADEDEIYAALGLDPIPPELREGLGEAERAQDGSLPDLVTLDDVRGDLQMHTTYSDGSTSVLAMADKAAELGYGYLLVTDHGPSLTVADAPSIAELREQGEEIQRLNEDPDIEPTVLCGVEANVTADGTDVPPEVCEELDLVVASLHDTVDDATERVVRAFDEYAVDVFGHPSNRLLNEREGNDLDVDRIVEAAKRNDVAIEINAQPKRLDLDWRLAREHRGEVGFILSTDAHAPASMELMRYGVDQARKAGLEPEHVLNAQPLDDLLAALGRG